jgi:hypothetical protein
MKQFSKIILYLAAVVVFFILMVTFQAATVILEFDLPSWLYPLMGGIVGIALGILLEDD